MKLRKMTFAALLTACALIIFTVEAQLPSLTPVPGIKPGLANIITVFCLCTLGAKYALGILIARVLLGSFLTGQVSAVLYSLSGGLLAWGVSALLRRFFPVERVWVLSVFSAIAHNCGQILCAVLITETASLFWYLPVLLIAGIITGAFTGLCAQLLLRRLGHRLRF